MNLKTNLLALLLLLVGAVALNAQTQTPVAVYTGVCDSQYYRIPAIVTANNGDLLFFNDDRKNNNSDVGSRGSNQNGIGLLVKRLSYNTTSQSYSTPFSSPLNITPSSGSYCYGDPAVVADRESGEVLVLTIGGAGASSGHWTGNKTSFAIKSTDNGQTWGPPVQLSLPTVTTSGSSVAGFFFASGRILQSKVVKKPGANYYRIYSAILAHESSGSNYNKVFYSDDFGTTWYLLGSGDAQSSADEAKLEELPNGDLILSTRAAGGRYFNTFTYSDVQNGMGSWGTPLQFYRFTTNTSSTCTINGDMLTMTAYRKSNNQEVTLLLQSTITGRSNSTDAANSRKNVKIFYHEIDTNTTVANLTSGWTATSFTLPNTSTFGGYSAMTLQADDKIGVYYEGNTTTCTGVNDFSNLYYIAYTLEELTGDAYTLTNPNPPTDPDVEVPDGIVPIYQWQGSHSDRWSDPLNWTVINAVNNTPLARGMVPPTPDENSNVKIEAPGAGEFNPVLETQLTVKNLYVAPGAAIGNQYWLRVSDKVYTDVEIPTNQWVRMSMPLRDTYSGDMYTTTQGGVMPDDEFTAATYNPSDGNSGHNRVFPYAIYQRVFSDAVNVMTDDQTGTEVRQLNSSWSVPYNDLAAKYQVAEGFDLWAPSTEATATFRFPSETDVYEYYYSNGNASTRKESVNHAASGTMAYGNSGNGVMDVTLTRASRANGTDGNGVPMYAVGNPSFSYLDIAEFIRVNAYGASHSGNASVVGNITPYVYKYDEGENLNGGEASETIYYLDNDKKLHKVTAAVSDTVSNTTMPDNSTMADTNGVYVAPTRGFRVMAGQAEVSAVEPKLIGNYSTSEFQIAPLKIVDGTTYSESDLNNASPNTYLHISSVANNAEGKYSSTLAISLGNTPDEVVIMGVCGFGMVRGKVDPINQTITIPAGSPCSYITLNATWQALSNNSGTADLKIYAWDGTVANCSTQINGKFTQYATNLDNSTPVVLDYTIASDNTVAISSRTGFVLYPCREDKGDVLGTCPLYYMNLTNKAVTPNYNYGTFPAALNAYNYMNASTTRETSTDVYIYPEIFGTYRYMVQSVVAVNGAPNITKSVQSFDILPIEGSYNTVRISGLYEGSETSETNDILGYISHISTGYRLTIPGGQVIANGSGSFPDYFVLYSVTGRNNDMNFAINNTNGSVYLYISNYSSTGSLQISRYDSNPKVSESPGYYANGLSRQNTTSASEGRYMVRTAQYTPGSSGNTGNPTFTVGTNYEAINLKFTAGMFDANPGNTPSASSAPRKTAAQGSTMASVILKDGDRTANTLITRRENGHNGYNAFEDASLIDVNDNAKSIATLAGNQMVAVNTLGDTTAVQLVLNNANGNVALTFDNLAALGSNARLFDATTGSETPLDANHQELTVNMTVNDSPLRYSIIWDVVSGTEEVELPLTDGDLWFKALSTAKGTIKVVSSENMAFVRLFDSTGKLVGSKVNAQNETMFEYLLSGIYVVEVSNGSETQSMKVNVK